MNTIKHLTCGCCTNGCVCTIHEDTPRGEPARMCDHCAPLPFAPLDRIYRYDVVAGEYLRKPQGKGQQRPGVLG